jgi:tetrahydromethanopterin S-methyltransferase subunit F
MFQEGAKFERMIKQPAYKAAVVEDKKRAALIARNKQLLGMLKSTKLTMILEQGKRLKTN